MAASLNMLTNARRHRAGRERGFTLIELMVALALLIVILAGIYTVWLGLQRTYNFAQDDIVAQDQARAALAEMVEYIRTARLPEAPPTDDLRLVIVSADATSLVCWTDTDRDAAHDLELVRFRVDTATRTLYRDQSHTGDITFATGTSIRLVGNWVSNDSSLPLFTYESSNGTVLPAPVLDPMSIRTVTIDLRIDIETGKAPIAHQLSSVVQPRNLRTY